MTVEPAEGSGTPVPRAAESRVAPLGVGRALALLALFSCLAVFHTWPLASAPGTLSRHDNADALLNEWTVAWVAHQTVRNPRRLFDANIFHPEPNTLAFSEHLFVQAMMGAPLLLAGLSTTAVHNLLIIAGFALTGWTMALVLWRWTGDGWAAVLGGMLLAFNAHSLSRIAHLQAVHVEFLPLAMYGLDRLLSVPRVRNALGLALAFALQSLTSNYLLVFMTFGLTGAALLRAREWLGPGRMRTTALVCLAGTIGALLVAPFLYHYLLAKQEQGLVRSLDEVATYAASWRDYVAASGTLHHQTWSGSFGRGLGAYLFPGVTAILLTGVAVMTGRAWNRPARLWVGLGLTGLVLSFGTALPGYEFLYRAVPLLQGIRASVRFGYLALAAIAALAAFGLAALRARTGDRRQFRLALSIAAVLLVTVEAMRVPVGYTTARTVPAVYRFLADEPNAVVVELPLFIGEDQFRNGRYMLHSTRHWRPLLNGYSGFTPDSYVAHWEAMRVFPDRHALDYLRRLGVTHVFVHAAWFAEKHGEDRLALIPGAPGLTRILDGGNLSIYLLSPGP
jgi:hypothetical protein